MQGVLPEIDLPHNTRLFGAFFLFAKGFIMIIEGERILITCQSIHGAGCVSTAPGHTGQGLVRRNRDGESINIGIHRHGFSIGSIDDHFHIVTCSAVGTDTALEITVNNTGGQVTGLSTVGAVERDN